MMNKEERKEYNKLYFEKNKETILDKHYRKKVQCEFCHRVVSVNNLAKHKNYLICLKKSAEIAKNEKRKMELTNFQPNCAVTCGN